MSRLRRFVALKVLLQRVSTTSSSHSLRRRAMVAHFFSTLVLAKNLSLHHEGVAFYLRGELVAPLEAARVPYSGIALLISDQFHGS